MDTIQWICSYMIKLKKLLNFLEKKLKKIEIDYTSPPPPPNKNDKLLHIRNANAIILLGGLGNQMFQYAFLKGMQALYPERMFLLDIYSDHCDLSNHNGFELLRVFNIPETDLLPKDWVRSKDYMDMSLLHEDPHKSGALVFNEQVMNLPPGFGPYIFKGYWQSENYFAHSIDDIHKVFKFTDLDQNNQELLEEIENNNSVVVHVRRGDYVNTMFDVLDFKYYKKAIDKMVKMLSEPPIFYIFSNDYLYCKRIFFELEQVYKIRYVRGNTKNDSWKDMALMKGAKHFIIANSSFSWWAAYLGTYPHKQVLAPRHWFLSSRYSNLVKCGLPPNYSISDICPKQWILLDSNLKKLSQGILLYIFVIQFIRNNFIHCKNMIMYLIKLLYYKIIRRILICLLAFYFILRSIYRLLYIIFTKKNC